jgi:uncharacterized protein
MISTILTKALFSPRRQPLVKNPEDYGMKYENIEFLSPDGLKLEGWFIPGKSDKLIIITHPSPFNRYGFSIKHQGFFKISDIGVELLKTAKHLNKEGYNIFTFDFRNHGMSEKGNKGFTGVGLFEWQDIIGALNYIKASNILKTYDIGFVSHCLGANSTIIAMSKQPKKFENIKCLVAIQPISTNVLTKCMLLDKYPLFKSRYHNINKKSIEYTGFSLKEMSPVKYIKDIQVPVFYVQVKNDPWTRPSDVQNFYDNTAGPKELFWIEGDLKRFDGYNYFGSNPQRLLKFLHKYM